MTRFRTRGGIASWSGGVLVVAGFYAVVLGWHGAASRTSPALQLPYLVSGGFGGLAMITFGALLLHLDRAQTIILLAFAGLPTAASCYVLAARMGYHGAYVAALVTISTLLGMVSLPFALAVLGGVGP